MKHACDPETRGRPRSCLACCIAVLLFAGICIPEMRGRDSNSAGVRGVRHNHSTGEPQYWYHTLFILIALLVLYWYLRYVRTLFVFSLFPLVSSIPSTCLCTLYLVCSLQQYFSSSLPFSTQIRDCIAGTPPSKYYTV